MPYPGFEHGLLQQESAILLKRYSSDVRSVLPSIGIH